MVFKIEQRIKEYSKEFNSIDHWVLAVLYLTVLGWFFLCNIGWQCLIGSYCAISGSGWLVLTVQYLAVVASCSVISDSGWLVLLPLLVLVVEDDR
jgi:hypothetical protein